MIDSSLHVFSSIYLRFRASYLPQLLLILATPLSLTHGHGSSKTQQAESNTTQHKKKTRADQQDEPRPTGLVYVFLVVAIASALLSARWARSTAVAKLNATPSKENNTDTHPCVYYGETVHAR